MSDDALDGEYIPNPGPEEAPNDEDLSAESLLKYSQRVRKDLVQEITRGGMPDDKGDRQVLLQALHDMDQTSVNRMKLDVDKENSANARQAQEIVDRLFGVNPYGLRARPGEERTELPAPPDDELPEVDIDEGEKEIGLQSETSKDFLERMESK